ncbi:MAG: efflux RND transporter periplasmic adaptor subunit [Acidobacteriia bacterium]|nr:efflux RND transporter periplasmic adaptor subunit [Terriglobia bacterium]
MKHNSVVPAAFAAAFLVLLSASGCSRPGPTVTADPGTPVVVQAIQVQPEKVQRTVELVGTLEGEHEVTVSSEVSGRVLAVRADLGDHVTQGQALVEIDSRELTLAVDRQRAALQQALASLGLSKENDPMPAPEQTSVVRKAAADLSDARTNFERAQSLLAKNVVARQVYDSAEARYQAAEANYTSALEGVRNLVAQVENLRAQLALARKKVTDTVVRAPFDGTVRARMVEIGQYVKEQGAIMSITSINPLKLRAGIPEHWFPYVAVGARVDLAVEAYHEEFQGRVVRVARTVDPQSRTFSIEAEVENSRERLRPGLFARAVLITSKADLVLRVPAGAVISYYGVQKVYEIENGQIREKVVKLGDRFGDVIEITEGVTPGAWIAATELTRIHQGSRVEIKKES